MCTRYLFGYCSCNIVDRIWMRAQPQTQSTHQGPGRPEASPCSRSQCYKGSAANLWWILPILLFRPWARTNQRPVFRSRDLPPANQRTVFINQPWYWMMIWIKQTHTPLSNLTHTQTYFHFRSLHIMSCQAKGKWGWRKGETGAAQLSSPVDSYLCEWVSVLF